MIFALSISSILQLTSWERQEYFSVMVAKLVKNQVTSTLLNAQMGLILVVSHFLILRISELIHNFRTC